MKMRTACALLALTLLLAGCGNESRTAESPAVPTAAETAAVEETKQKTAKEELPAFSGETAADNEHCLIRVTDIDPDGMFGYTLKVYLENRTADKTLMFAVESAAINGVQTDPAFAAEVSAGKKANKEISFFDTVLTANDVGAYTDIELTFRVYDSNDWLADNVARETVHIYPYGKDKATAFEREAQPGDKILVDNDSAAVIVTGYEPDDFWGYTVQLYLVNKTDSALMFAVDEASVNGFMTDPFWASSVNAGKVKFSSISWTKSALEENSITDVDEIEMTLKIYDVENWTSGNVFNGKVTLEP